MSPPRSSDGKEPPEVLQIRFLYTKAYLAAQDAKRAAVPGVSIAEAQTLVLQAQVALLEAQIEHGRWMAP